MWPYQDLERTFIDITNLRAIKSVWYRLGYVLTKSWNTMIWILSRQDLERNYTEMRLQETPVIKFHLRFLFRWISFWPTPSRRDCDSETIPAPIAFDLMDRFYWDMTGGSLFFHLARRTRSNRSRGCRRRRRDAPSRRRRRPTSTSWCRPSLRASSTTTTLTITTRWSTVSLFFYWVLPSFTGCYRVLLAFTEFYLLLPSFTGFHWVSLGFTEFYWGLIRFYRVLLGFTGF